MKIHLSEDAHATLTALPPGKKEVARKLIHELESMAYPDLAKDNQTNGRLLVGQVETQNNGNFVSIRLPHSGMRVIAEKPNQASGTDELKIIDLFSYAF